jgi:6-phosphogluconolactonase
VRIQVELDRESAARAAAELLAAAAEAGEDIALSGGSTVGRAYELAAEADWSRARIWFGDDRAVPPDDERSNYRLVEAHLLARLDAPPEVHRIPGELGAEAAADAYDRELDGVEIGLNLLGLGADGHTASLFPGSPQLEVRDRRVTWGPAGLEPFVDRVTMTVPALRASRTVVYLVAGADKAEAVRRAFAGQPDPATPAGLVRSEHGTTIAILDRDAASLLDKR